ncbi:hypothetical protein [Burkholderia vietnamiensis]|uniref:hypothetical protein n=1 Tax=Burkholderia vietnamiensis TaxID=60552 RepID=UPI001CF5445F|nr:hypothetical protein [Burkholderia vietnamiensis]MCA8197285.1 hypothetical protein [Burkholderia vietnamiensis]
MSTKPQHLATGEQIARALSQLGEEVTAERVAQIQSRIVTQSFDEASLQRAVDGARRLADYPEQEAINNARSYREAVKHCEENGADVGIHMMLLCEIVERARVDETYRHSLFRDSPDVAADVQYMELPELERRAVDQRRERVRQLRSLLDECAADPLLAEVCRPELERIAEAVFGPKRLTHAHINEAVHEAGIRPTFQQSWKLCELLDQKPLYYRPDLLEKHRKVPQETAPSPSL